MDCDAVTNNGDLLFPHFVVDSISVAAPNDGNFLTLTVGNNKMHIPKQIRFCSRWYDIPVDEFTFGFRVGRTSVTDHLQVRPYLLYCFPWQLNWFVIRYLRCSIVGLGCMLRRMVLSMLQGSFCVLDIVQRDIFVVLLLGPLLLRRRVVVRSAVVVRSFLLG